MARPPSPSEPDRVPPPPVERPGEAIGHADLLRTVWEPGYDDDLHLLRVTMRNLRAKLADAAAGRRYVLTVNGIGYRLAPVEE